MAIYLTNPDGLIGDFLGTIPTMIKLAKKDKLYVTIHPEIIDMFNIIPKKYNIELCNNKSEINDNITKEYNLDISKAFDLAHQKNLYMSQAHFPSVDLPIPEIVPKAELDLGKIDNEIPEFDYLISPFARSLPPEQLWSRKNWQELVDSYPEYKFGVLGTCKHNPLNYIIGPNVTDFYDKSFIFVGNVMKKCKFGMISVITGTSHFAFHLGVKNYLLNNQGMTWGVNPEAINIKTDIQELTVEELRKVLDNGRNNSDL